MSAKLASERLFVAPARNGNRSKAHLCRKLHAEVPKPAYSENRDGLTRARATVAQSIKGCHARAHQRASLNGRKTIGEQGNCCPVRDQVISVTAIMRKAGDPTRLASKKIAAATRLTVTAVPAMPADADSLTVSKIDDRRTYSINSPNDLMPGDARIFDGHRASLDQGVTVADATSLNLDAYGSRAGLRDVALDEF
jgi:hypothetical protein